MRKFSLSLLKIMVSVGLMVALMWKVDLSQIAVSFKTVAPAFLLAAFALLAAGRLMMCLRARMLLGAKGIPISFWEVVKLYWKCDFAGVFLPGTVGGDALRMLGLARGYTETRHAVTAVAMDRALGMLAFLVLGFVGVFLAGLAGLVPGNLTWVFAEAVGIAALAVFYFFRWGGMGLFRRAGGGPALVARLKSWVAAFLEYGRHKRLLAKGLALSLVVQIMRVITTYMLSLGLGMDVSLAYYLICVPVAFLAVLLPVSMGGWGMQEGAYVVMLTAVGADAADAFTLSVLSSLITIAVSLPGLVFFLKEGFVGRKETVVEAVTR
ncbi:MAG: flippase-like domain-containing protein [Candidatus Omnitrophica bacterium]|nr:flippase-like domain-containing protein [Candidatus Omnitrophota bacterium]